jgi:hypothetical protein
MAKFGSKHRYQWLHGFRCDDGHPALYSRLWRRKPPQRTIMRCSRKIVLIGEQRPTGSEQCDHKRKCWRAVTHRLFKEEFSLYCSGNSSAGRTRWFPVVRRTLKSKRPVPLGTGPLIPTLGLAGRLVQSAYALICPSAGESMLRRQSQQHPQRAKRD